jgi:hypothetical protein
MSFHRKQPMGTFRRGLTVSPFQIPIMIWLLYAGITILLGAPVLTKQLELHHSWPIYNFAIILIVGAGLNTFSRFNGNERLEEFSLWLSALAIVIATGIQLTAHTYDLADEAAIFAGCLLRIRVLRKSRKAERLAIQIVTYDNEGEQD